MHKSLSRFLILGAALAFGFNLKAPNQGVPVSSAAQEALELLAVSQSAKDDAGQVDFELASKMAQQYREKIDASRPNGASVVVDIDQSREANEALAAADERLAGAHAGATAAACAASGWLAVFSGAAAGRPESSVRNPSLVKYTPHEEPDSQRIIDRAGGLFYDPRRVLQDVKNRILTLEEARGLQYPEGLTIFQKVSEINTDLQDREYIKIAEFSPDVRLLATGTNLGKVTVWNLDNGHKLTEFTGPKVPISSLSWSHDSTRVSYCSAGESPVEIRSVGDGASVPVNSRYEDPIGFCPVSNKMFASRGDWMERIERIKIYNFDTRETSRPLLFKRMGTIYRGAWSPDGMYIALATLKGFIAIFNAETLERVSTFEQSVRFWSLNERYEDSCAIDKLVWSPDSTMIAVLADQAGLCVWNVETSRLISSLKLQEQCLKDSIAWCDGGKALVSCGAGDEPGTICFHNPYNLEEINIKKVSDEEDERIIAMASSRDTNCVALVSNSNRILIYKFMKPIPWIESQLGQP